MPRNVTLRLVLRLAQELAEGYSAGRGGPEQATSRLLG